MAKKKEIKLESQQTRGVGEGADPNDPVAIVYNNELIASLNDTDDEGVLKTEGTIVPHDIHVRYAGSPLPPSTAQDAGKVLTVGSTGAAEWAAASGINDLFYLINIAMSYGQGGITWSLIDQTYDEIFAVANANDGKIAILMLHSSDGESEFVTPMLCGRFSIMEPDMDIKLQMANISPSVYGGLKLEKMQVEVTVCTIASDGTVSATGFIGKFSADSE